MDIRLILYVGISGMFGSIIRYLISIFMVSKPWPTFLCNLLGSLLIGFLIGIAKQGLITDNQKIILATGFCGGFTTFSAFALENYYLIEEGKSFSMIIYTLASVILGILLVFVGLYLGKNFKY